MPASGQDEEDILDLERPGGLGHADPSAGGGWLAAMNDHELAWPVSTSARLLTFLDTPFSLVGPSGFSYHVYIQESLWEETSGRACVRAAGSTSLAARHTNRHPEVPLAPPAPSFSQLPDGDPLFGEVARDEHPRCVLGGGVEQLDPVAAAPPQAAEPALEDEVEGLRQGAQAVDGDHGVVTGSPGEDLDAAGEKRCEL